MNPAETSRSFTLHDIALCAMPVAFLLISILSLR